MQRRTVIINSALAVGVLALAGAGYGLLGTSSKAKVATQTVRVSQGNIAATVSATGNAQSATNLGVSFTDCTGTLTSVSVKAGDAVTAGQVLASVDPTTAQAAVATAQTALSAAQAAQSQAISQARTQLSNAETTQSLDKQMALDTYNTAVAKPGADTTAAGLQYQSSLLKDQQSVSSAQTALTQAQSSTTQAASA